MWDLDFGSGKADPAVGWRRARIIVAPGLCGAGALARESEMQRWAGSSNRSRPSRSRVRIQSQKPRAGRPRHTIRNAKLPAAVSSPPRSSPQKIIRFAVFEVDLAAGELRKNGARIRLQEQPFQILAYLIDRAGEVVTREELRQKLWPADTFVDFDHSLNTAINKLREALGDSASNPRYVETLARRGYRFLAPLQTASESAGLPGSTARTGRNCGPGGLPS